MTFNSSRKEWQQFHNRMKAHPDIFRLIKDPSKEEARLLIKEWNERLWEHPEIAYVVYQFDQWISTILQDLRIDFAKYWILKVAGVLLILTPVFMERVPKETLQISCVVGILLWVLDSIIRPGRLLQSRVEVLFAIRASRKYLVTESNFVLEDSDREDAARKAEEEKIKIAALLNQRGILTMHYPTEEIPI